MNESIVEFISNGASWVGLMSDFVGAIFLARSVFKARIRDIIDSTVVYPGGNENQRRSLLEQNIEAQVGVPCIAFGFFAQFLASLLKNLGYWYVAVVVFLLGVVLYFCLKACISQKMKSEVTLTTLIRRLADCADSLMDEPVWQGKIINEAAACGVRMKPTESFREFVKRLVDKPIIKRNRPTYWKFPL